MPSAIGEYLVRYLDARPGWSPDLTLRSAKPGDRYLICSDGVSGVLEPNVIQDVLAGIRDLDQAVEELVRLTYELGAPDNVTAIAVDVPDGAWDGQDGSPVILGAAADLAASS
jgi:PPM family protein phosphatase